MQREIEVNPRAEARIARSRQVVELEGVSVYVSEKGCCGPSKRRCVGRFTRRRRSANVALDLVPMM